jgi:O-antigen ligase
MLCITVGVYPVTEPAEMTSGALNASRIAELGSLGIAAGIITIAILRRRCTISVVSGPLLPIVVLFTLWAMFSAIWSVNPILSFARGSMLLMMVYIAVALAIYIRDISSDSVRAVGIIMASALLGSIVVLLFANIILSGTPLPFTEGSSWSGRPGRLYFGQAGPLETGELLALAIVISAFGIRRLGTKVVLLFVLFVLLYLTNARNLLVFVPVAIAAGLFRSGSIRTRFLLTSVAIGAFSLLLIFVFSGDFARILPKDISTFNGRTPLWAIAGENIGENPFLGVGYYATRYYLTATLWTPGHTHNAYVETAMSLGLIGLSMLLIFLAYSIRVSISDKSGLLATILVLCCLGSIFDPLMIASTPYTFYLLGALFVVSESVVRQRAVQTDRAVIWRSTAVLNR